MINTNFRRVQNEFMLDWNGPTLSEDKLLLRDPLIDILDLEKTLSSHFFVSHVVDRINSEPIRLSFME